MSARVTHEVVDLTVKLATELLANNDGNRKLSARRVSTLAATIARAGWEFNGETIIVDNEGHLLNGQHRCAAVIEAKTPIKVLMVRGVPRKVFATIDNVKSRSAADVLTAGGTSVGGNTTAATLRLVWQYTLGVLCSTSAQHQPSNSDIMAASKDFPGAIESVVWARRHKFLGNATVAFMHWVTTRGNRSEAEKFWDHVEFGENLPRNDPALRLRERLLAGHPTRQRGDAFSLLQLIMRAWVNHLSGIQAEFLRTNILDNRAMRNNKDEIVIPMTTEAALRVTSQARRMSGVHKKGK